MTPRAHYSFVTEVWEFFRYGDSVIRPSPGGFGDKAAFDGCFFAAR